MTPSIADILAALGISQQQPDAQQIPANPAASGMVAQALRQHLEDVDRLGAPRPIDAAAPQPEQRSPRDPFAGMTPEQIAVYFGPQYLTPSQLREWRASKGIEEPQGSRLERLLRSLLGQQPGK